jgi:hypothetical protein
MRGTEIDGWKTTFGCGPVSARETPPELREGMLAELAWFQRAGLYGFQVNAWSSTDEVKEGSVLSLLAPPDATPDESVICGVGQACDAVASFLGLLQQEEYDVVTLPFALTGRRLAEPVPAPQVVEVPTLVEGLRLVTEAIDQIISRQGARGGCDWAMLCCDRNR